MDEILAPDGSPYMRRYWLFGHPKRSVPSRRYHEILQSDADRDLHDHPWAFTTTILDGGYDEHTPDGVRRIAEGDSLHHDGTDLHRLELTRPVWTYVETGRIFRKWGFQTSRGWMYWRDYRTGARVW